jgi:hypothetical protein
MLYKEDWDKVRQRFEAYWENEIIDRCCVAVGAPKIGRIDIGEKYPRPSSHEELLKWHRDPELVLKRFVAANEGYYHGGEGIPVLTASWGGSGFALYMGCKYHYTKDSLWFHPTLNSADEYENLKYNSKDKEFIEHKKFLETVTAYAKDKFFVAMPEYIGNLDTVLCMRGNEDALIDMLDEPEKVQIGIKAVRDTAKLAGREFFDIIRKSNHGGSCVQWFNTWAPGTHCLVQCDFSTMLSPKMFEEYAVPDLEDVCGWLDYAAYHIDGEEQLRFLDMLLSINSIKAFQWTNVAGQPSVLNYIPVFKKIQRAGKRLILYCNPNEVEELMLELSPRGLLINVLGASSESEAREIVKKVGEWTRS